MSAATAIGPSRNLKRISKSGFICSGPFKSFEFREISDTDAAASKTIRILPGLCGV